VCSAAPSFKDKTNAAAKATNADFFSTMHS
jgi:hypothetical protein